MADVKITALTVLTAADPINDAIPIVDVSDNSMAASGTTKRISVNNILGASGTATLASATITGDLTVRTNKLAVTSTGVGIGTVTPNAAYILDLTTSNDARARQWVADTGHIATGNLTNGYQLRTLGASSDGIKIANYANSVEYLRIDNTNNVTVQLGNVVMATSGKGIDFSAVTGGTGTATANVLNDYEEGTWVPVVADAGTGGNVGTYSNNGSTYTKIGRQVTVQTYISAINTTGMTAGNFFRIRGLPFTAVRGGNGNFYTYRVGRNASTVSSSVSLSDGNSNVSFPLYTTNSATTDLGILVSDIVSGTSEIVLSLTYFV